MKKILKLIKEPSLIWLHLPKLKLSKIIPDKLYLKLIFKKHVGYKLNLKNPQTFNEKLQWKKLYDRKAIYTKLADKLEVRNYVKEKIGEKYLIPLLGVWNKFEDIDFLKLPEQFVLKCNHDSGSVIVCKDKKNFNYNLAKEKINKKLKNNLFFYAREWCYKDIKPKILAEKYIEDYDLGELRDYKFFCFNGVVKMMYIASERMKGDTKFDFFDNDFNHLPVLNAHPNSSTIIKKPINFEKMMELSSMLSRGIEHVRVDFYEANGKVFFSEMTFYHNAGLTSFIPKEYDYLLGSYINLSVK